MVEVKVVSVDASIGCGKTTLINEIMKYNDNNTDNVHFQLVPEPVDLWMKTMVGDIDILSAFYKDTKSTALPFQLVALLTRKIRFDQEMANSIKFSEETGKRVIMITERTIHSDKHIFAKMLHKSNNINDAGIVAYNMWNDYYAKDSPVDKVIYINIPPEVCHERIKLRARPGEEVIPLKYLIDCQTAHDEFFDDVLSKMDCITIDTFRCLKDTDEYKQLIDDVIKFILK